MKKTKRKIRYDRLVILILVPIVILVLILLPGYLASRRYKVLGWNSAQIKEIKEQGLSELILNNGYYSESLARAIHENRLNTEYTELFLIRDDVDEDDFLLYDRLKDIGYESDQLENLFTNLRDYELTPLLVFDYQYDERDYVSDCLEHREENSPSSFHLSGSYRTDYKAAVEAEKPDSANVLVSSKSFLKAGYEPSDLVDLPLTYAVSGMSLRRDASDALMTFASLASNEGAPFFVRTSYRSYEQQNAAYERLLAYLSPEKADRECIRAGYTEHQTGLAVNIQLTYADEETVYEETEEMPIINRIAPSTGFIQRYPPEKSQITGIDDEPEHYRYLGKQLAAKVSESQLTYDEYYGLYLRSWNDSANIPSDAVLARIENYSSTHRTEKASSE